MCLGIEGNLVEIDGARWGEEEVEVFEKFRRSAFLHLEATLL